jgi:hypothetical protein
MEQKQIIEQLLSMQDVYYKELESQQKEIRSISHDMKSHLRYLNTILAQGQTERAQEYVKMGYRIGVGGVVTFKNARKLVQTVEEIPLSAIVLETDCPYMAPEPHRGTRNDSRNIPYVIEKIAKIKGISAEEVEETTRENAFALFSKVPR